MADLERELRSVLRRKQPPAGFAEQVLRRTGGTRRRASRWVAAAVAASLALTIGGWQYRRYRAEQAKQQVLLALEITSEKLAIVEKALSDLNRRVVHE